MYNHRQAQGARTQETAVQALRGASFYREGLNSAIDGNTPSLLIIGTDLYRKIERHCANRFSNFKWISLLVFSLNACIMSTSVVVDNNQSRCYGQPRPPLPPVSRVQQLAIRHAKLLGGPTPPPTLQRSKSSPLHYAKFATLLSLTAHGLPSRRYFAVG